MEVVQADLEVAQASVDRLEQKCVDAAASSQDELQAQVEAYAVLQKEHDDAQEKIVSLESQQAALEEACKEHKQQVCNLYSTKAYICAGGTSNSQH